MRPASIFLIIQLSNSRVCAFRNDANLIGAAANWTQRTGKEI